MNLARYCGSGQSVVCPAATTVGYEPRASGVRQFTGMRRLSFEPVKQHNHVWRRMNTSLARRALPDHYESSVRGDVIVTRSEPGGHWQLEQHLRTARDEARPCLHCGRKQLPTIQAGKEQFSTVTRPEGETRRPLRSAAGFRAPDTAPRRSRLDRSSTYRPSSGRLGRRPQSNYRHRCSPALLRLPDDRRRAGRSGTGGWALSG